MVRLVRVLPGNDARVTGIAAGLAAIGGATERMIAAAGATARQVRVACAAPINRRVPAVVAAGVLVVYLFAIGEIAVSVSDVSSATATWQAMPDNLFRTKAPYLFEPVVAVRPNSYLTVLISPVNIGLGSIVAALAAANVAVSRYASQQTTCRRRAYGRLAGVLPALGLGFACCAPTLLLVAGASVSAAFLPAMLAIRPALYPLSIFLLSASLVWAARPGFEPAKLPPPSDKPSI